MSQFIIHKLSRMSAVIDRLISAVGRAFFTDNTVVILDALARDKYIKEEELAPRLRMDQKQAIQVFSCHFRYL